MKISINFNELTFEFNIHSLKDDRFLSKELFNTGVWEKHISQIWFTHIKPNSEVLDIGANIGWYSKLALMKGCIVHSFEPDPNNYRLLEENCADANLYNFCLGNEDGPVYLKFDKHNYGNTSVSLDTGQLSEQKMLDQIIQDPTNINAIKIDVQGWEPHVIAGGRTLFKNLPKGCLVLIEFSPSMLIKNNFNINCLDEFFKLFNTVYFYQCSTPLKYGVNSLLTWAEENIGDDLVYADVVCIK